ncbi:MAG: uroporphyrinogen decarboxylase family protein [Candidatus Aminicenantaceae bacterium]
MDSKERMARAMNLEEPDRVPVMCQMSFGHMLLQTGIRPLELWFSKEVFVEALLKLRELYQFDGILISLHGHSSHWMKDIKNIKKDKNQEIITWKDGSRTIFPLDDLPRHYPANIVPSPLIENVDPDSIPENIDFIPVSQGLDFHINSHHLYDVFYLIKEKAGDLFSVHSEVTSPFDYFLHLFGVKNAMMSLIEAPVKSMEILQRFTQGVKKIAVDQAEIGVDAVKISSPYAGAGFLSPEFYRRFILPCESQIVNAVRDLGTHIYIHTCGAINDRLEMMAESGASGIECLDPPPIGNVSLEEAKDRIGHKVFIKGNIDPINVLVQGSVEDVKKDAAHRIEIGKTGGGFILSTACSIAPYTKRENVQVLTDVSEEVGQYK